MTLGGFDASSPQPYAVLLPETDQPLTQLSKLVIYRGIMGVTNPYFRSFVGENPSEHGINGYKAVQLVFEQVKTPQLVFWSVTLLES